ncbi:glycoside hydrolase family 2 [Microlunatus panaciterrae]|uniref:Beta-galactosidase/beta-glucuronidase n=1 Tax=Microlunatus panaciterrae TaxID=400768 RepID=A0ABS2RQE6_9ACTN|nr:sugar-binding domain-containing protein [Microlunatus panaciterrae]MBM7800386.1 beta-galactosidase/beta-glucuronidase [Microlunatus panaciterrae]
MPADPGSTATTTAARDDSVPRPEYPRPQLVRERWLNLNGEWEFEIDQGDSGLERGLLSRPLASSITVPFAPEAELSGIGNTDFLHAVWYRREVQVPADWQGQQILLHFQAVDYDATVWVNGIEVTRHRGGFSPFSADITAALVEDDVAEIVVRARDTRDEPQPRGKQSSLFHNHDCDYTRTTGIWQTVWLEPVPVAHLQRPRISPDVAGSRFHLRVPLTNRGRHGLRVRADLLVDGQQISTDSAAVGTELAAQLVLDVDEQHRRLWSPEDPFLYGLTLTILGADGTVVDTVDSYAGLRSVSIDGQAILVNGERLFQRLVLDQGYWPQSLMTAPSEQALIDDIRLSMEAGFNGARMHQKVFEERFLYHADKMGYLLWGEFADWGCSVGTERDNQRPSATYVTQWLEVLDRDYNHPAIIGWCPLNETHQVLHDRITVLDDVTRAMFLATKAADLTRPVLDTSGYSHRVFDTDVWDSHNYEQDPALFADQLAGLAEGRPYSNNGGRRGEFNLPYNGQPYFVSEFGGIWWNAEEAAAADPTSETWGYGERVRDIEEFHQRFDGLVEALLGNPLMFGYCYTQLTDVFQETNGIYHFDRTAKFDLERIRRTQNARAAYESGTKRTGE